MTNLNDAQLVQSIGVPRAFYNHRCLIDEGFRNLDNKWLPDSTGLA